MPRILVVEDDAVIASGLRRALEAEGHQVVLATDGEQGLHAARTCGADLVVLDVMMPYLNGFEITTELRRAGDAVPIIILSARGATRDKIRGLDLGADDYLTKPFEIDELLARVRRRLGTDKSRRTRAGDLEYDWQLNLLTRLPGGEPVELGGRELRLVEFFFKRAGQLVSREQIIAAVWGDDYDGTDRTVDNVIVALRRKLGPDTIETVRGQGYRFRVTRP